MLGCILLGSSPTASCRGVGSGRRFGLKNRWGKPRAGSSPAPGTSDSISDSQVSPLKSNCYRRSPTEEHLLAACRMGMKPRGPENRRTWSPDLAYVVGLLATDGNLSPDGRHICFVSRDLQLIQTLASILHLNNRVGIKQGSYAPRPVFQIAFGDRLFYEWLTEIGITPRKTYTIGSLKVPDVFFPDFLRGHVDGDGSITPYVDRYNTKLSPAYVYQRLYVRFLSASPFHIDWLQATIRRLHGTDGHVTARRSDGQGKVPLYALKFAKKDSISLLRWMYYAPDVPCLARKRAIAEPFLTGELREFRHPR